MQTFVKKKKKMCLTEYLSSSKYSSKVGCSEKENIFFALTKFPEEGVGNTESGDKWNRNNQLTVERKPSRLGSNSYQTQNVKPALKKVYSRHIDHEMTVLEIFRVNRLC